MTLTPRQSQTLSLIKHWIDQNGYPPTRADIAGHFGFTRNAAECHLQELARKGYIALTPGISRGIKITESDDRALGMPLGAST